MKTVELWFEFASTYSHLAVQRVEPLARAAGVALVYRPFLLGPIFKAQGWNDSPFNVYPAKGAYMWRDLEREAAKYGLAFRRPSQFPRNGLLAARAATAVSSEPWLAAFVRAVYAANFVEDRDIADRAVVLDCLRAAGAPDPAAAVALADAPETKLALRAASDEAARRGIFGAPSFFVGGELYWGNDRLEDAIRAA